MLDGFYAASKSGNLRAREPRKRTMTMKKKKLKSCTRLHNTRNANAVCSVLALAMIKKYDVAGGGESSDAIARAHARINPIQTKTNREKSAVAHFEHSKIRSQSVRQSVMLMRRYNSSWSSTVVLCCVALRCVVVIASML